MAWYNHGKHKILNPSSATQGAPFLLMSDEIYVSMHTSAYTMSTDSDEYFTDVESTHFGYASGVAVTGYRGDGLEMQLASKAVTRVIASDRAEFDAADLVFTAIGNGTNDTFTDIIIFRVEATSTGSGADWDLIAHDDSFSATTSNGGNITLVWNANGILHIT